MTFWSGTGMTVPVTEGCLDCDIVTCMTYVGPDVGACHPDMVRLHHSLSEFGIGIVEDSGHGEKPACDVSILRNGF